MLLSTFALLLSAATPAAVAKDTPVPVVTSELDPRIARANARRQAALCRRAQQARGDPDRLTRGGPVNDEELIDLTRQLMNAQSTCSGDLDAPIALIERRLLPTALRAPNTELLYTLEEALRVRNAPEDSARRLELHRVIWVRGAYARISYTVSLWSDDEHRAFIARDDIWTWLSEQTGDTFARSQWYAALTDPLSPRHDINAAVEFEEASNDAAMLTRAAVRLLDGSEVAHDPARAERLLTRAARRHEPARLLLVPLVTERITGLSGAERRAIAEPLRQFAGERTPGGAAARAALLPILFEDMASSTTPEQERAAVGALQNYVALRTPAAEAPLLTWTQSRLRSEDRALRMIAYGNLSLLLRNGNAGAQALLAVDSARTGGIVQRAPLSTEDGNVGRFIGEDDYPSSAMREEHTGVVEAIVIFSPEGRAIGVEIARSGGPWLDRAVEGNAIRRLRLPTTITNGRYIRAALPPVHFVLPDDEVAPPMPLPEGVLVVRGRLIQRPNLEAPVHSTTVTPP